jgi:hypothetical protein
VEVDVSASKRLLSAVIIVLLLVGQIILPAVHGDWSHTEVTALANVGVAECDDTVTVTLRLSVQETEPETTAIEPVGEWNLIGHPSDVTGPITEALQGVDGRYDLVYAYHAEGGDQAWKTYNVARPPFLDTLTNMEPWRGYRVWSTGDCTLMVAYD